jgi:hypothetical protein
MANKLEVSLQLVDKLTSPLNKAAQDINGITKRIEGAFRFVTAATAITGLAVGIGAAVNKSIEFGDHIDGLSQKLNISAEAVQQWDIVLGNNKSSLDAASTGFQNLNSMAYSAAIGQKKSAILFKQLGIEVKDANGSLRSQNDILNDTIYKLADLKDATLQSALAQKLGLTEMLPLLRQGSQAIKDQLEQSKEYGILTGDNAKILADAKDKMDHFQRSMSVLTAELTVRLVPALSDGAEALAKFMGNLNKVINGPGEYDAHLSYYSKEIAGLTAEIEAYNRVTDKKSIFPTEEQYLNAKDRLEWLKKVSGDIKDITNGNGNTPTPGAPVIDQNAEKDIQAAAKKRIETWVKVSKEINEQVREENYAETKKLWEASHPDLGAKGDFNVELPEYLKENSPLTQNILKNQQIVTETTEQYIDRQVNAYSKLGRAIQSFTQMNQSLTEMRIEKARKEGTLTEATEKKYREQMKKRQIVLAAMAMAEAAAAAVADILLAVKSSKTWYEAAALIAASAIEVGTVAGTQIAAIKQASFAGGVRNYSGGYALVGEQGPEVRYIPPGSSIYNAHETSQMMNQPSQSIHVTLYDRSGSLSKEFEAGIRSGEFNTALTLVKKKIS